MYSITVSLETHSGKKLYEQIYTHIKNEIREGKFRAGERLPSTRSLAKMLMVSRSTAELAYEQLMAEGYIESVPCKGYFVCMVEELYEFTEEQTTFHHKREEKNEYLYDFSPYATDMTLFPFGAWRRMNKTVLTEDCQGLFQTGDPQGEEALRETICRYLHDSRGVNCKPDQIIVGAGNDYLLMLLEKIIGKTQCIAMENPTYKKAYQVFKSFGYDIDFIPMDGNGMKVEKLWESKAKIAYVMPSHQYPMGTVMPIGRRLELLSWAGKSPERFIIEDDYDSEFRYKGKPIPALQGVDRNGKVIYIGTFSKAIAPAIRVSYMVLPQVLLDRYRERCYFYSTTVSRIDQNVLDAFIKEGYFERYLNKMRTLYRKKHDVLMQEVQGLEGQFRITGENAGLHILLTSREKRNEEELRQKAKELGVKVYGLTEGLIEEKTSHTILLGYGRLSEEEIREGISLIKKAWLS